MEIEKSSSCRKFEANGWGGNAIKQQSIKGWTLNLNWRDKKSKDKELSRLRMIKLLTFDNLFPPIRHSPLNS